MKKTLKKIFGMPQGYSRSLHLATILLAVFGLIMAVSTNMNAAQDSLMPLINSAIKQLVYLILSCIAMYLAAKFFSFPLVRAIMPVLVAITICALAITRMFAPVNGAYAWIRLPIPGFEVTIQPSEFAKIMMIFIVAYFFGDKKPNEKTGWEVIKKPFYIMLVFVGIIMVIQKDLGSSLVLLALAFLCFIIPSNKPLRKYQNIALIIMIAGIAAVLFATTEEGIAFIKQYIPFLSGYQITRFELAVNPFVDRYVTGYQLVHSLIAFSRGGLFGLGLGKSLQKYGYLPEARTDFILAIIVEELGFIAFIFIVVLYAIIIYQLFRYAFRVQLERDKIILFGVAMYLFIHFLLNVGGVTALIPLTGVPLLLISSGGSSTMAVMMAIGICQNIIAKDESRRVKTEEEI